MSEEDDKYILLKEKEICLLAIKSLLVKFDASGKTLQAINYEIDKNQMDINNLRWQRWARVKIKKN